MISAHVCRVCDPYVLALKTGMDIYIVARSEEVLEKTLLLVRSGCTPGKRFTKSHCREL